MKKINASLTVFKIDFHVSEICMCNQKNPIKIRVVNFFYVGINEESKTTAVECNTVHFSIWDVVSALASQNVSN